MSMKALENVVGLLRSMAEEGSIAHDVTALALAELTALRKAAHLVAVVGQSEGATERYPEWVAACELLRSIAKEAP